MEGYDVRLALELRAAESAVGHVSDFELVRFQELQEASAEAVSHAEWDAANAAFHEHQVDLAGNSLLSRFYRELSVNLMMQVIRGGKLEARRLPRDRARGDRRCLSLRRSRARPLGDLRAHRDRPPDRPRRVGGVSRRSLSGTGVQSVPMATTDRRETESGIEVKPVYTADDVRRGRAGAPGRVPYTRGPYPDMYRGRPWTIRQYAGFASAEETNGRFRYLLERGQTGLSVAFDLPTQLGYDSDDPRAVGEVGRTGVAIDSLEDMRLLFDGIPLGEVSTSMTINAPASLLLLLYELVAEEQGVAAAALRGTVAERHPQGVRRARELHLPAAGRRCGSPPTSSPTAPSACRAGTRSRSPGTTSARRARPRCRSSRSRSRTGSPTARPPSRRGSRPTTSARASPSSSTRTTTSSRRWRSSGPRGGCGPRSCASASARRTRRRSRCASTRRPAARR